MTIHKSQGQITQQDNITKKTLLKAKLFIACFEDNAINSVTRQLI